MSWRVRKRLRVFAPGVSLRRRVVYSLGIVRLILVPVILLAVYYLFRMGYIVDRIVNVDAPVATMAERASIEMMDARRAEQDYFLSHDPVKLQANRKALDDLDQIIGTINALEPSEVSATQKMLDQIKLHREQLEQAVSGMGEARQAPVERIQQVVETYERKLDELLRRDHRESRGRLIDDLRTQVGSFDAQIASASESEDPALRQAMQTLQSSSEQVRLLASDLESRSWGRVLYDQGHARRIIHRAEWVLIIVSGLTIFLSVIVSFWLPRQVVKPLVNLKEAVDYASAGDYEIEFDVEGQGEVAQLAYSVRKLLNHVREKTESALWVLRR